MLSWHLIGRIDKNVKTLKCSGQVQYLGTCVKASMKHMEEMLPFKMNLYHKHVTLQTVYIFYFVFTISKNLGHRCSQYFLYSYIFTVLTFTICQ
jgi:hypothetical protein